MYKQHLIVNTDKRIDYVQLHCMGVSNHFFMCNYISLAFDAIYVLRVYAYTNIAGVCGNIRSSLLPMYTSNNEDALPVRHA